MKPHLAPVAALALVACQPQAPDERPAPAPAAPATSDFSQPMTARGNEPFWSLSLDGTHLTLTRPDHPDLVAETPGAAIQPGRATWIARSADGQQLTVSLYVSECSDGMSDRRYPMTAEVVLRNEALRGCAAKTEELKAAAKP